MPSAGGTGRPGPSPRSSRALPVLFMCLLPSGQQRICQKCLTSTQSELRRHGPAFPRARHPLNRGRRLSCGQAQEGQCRMDGAPPGGSFPWPVGTRGGRGPFLKRHLCALCLTTVTRAAVAGRSSHLGSFCRSVCPLLSPQLGWRHREMISRLCCEGHQLC